MICKLCGTDGLIFIHPEEGDGYAVAACICEHGRQWRSPWQLVAWAAQQSPAPAKVGALEEFFTAEEIATARTRVEDAPTWPA